MDNLTYLQQGYKMKQVTQDLNLVVQSLKQVDAFKMLASQLDNMVKHMQLLSFRDLEEVSDPRE